MSKVRLEDVDEVYLALTHTLETLRSDGHSPNEQADVCRFCFAMWLLERGIDAYWARLGGRE